ncbi:hypothetical protein [Candidatus Hodarchaeum mangrovi]
MMLDLLSAKGTLEILNYLKSNPQKTAPDINQEINESSFYSFRGKVTTATVYRRIKEMELAGLISRDPPNSKSYSLTPEGFNILEKELVSHPEFSQLSRSQRILLEEINLNEGINVIALQDSTQLSPNTVVQGLRELNRLDLIEETNYYSKTTRSRDQKEIYKKNKPGRPNKKIKPTKKGKKVYDEQKSIERRSK